MLIWCTTKTKGQSDKSIPKTLIHIHSRFCEGYGSGFIGRVLRSPNKDLLGTTIKVDMRNNLVNQYGNPVKRKVA